MKAYTHQQSISSSRAAAIASMSVWHLAFDVWSGLIGQRKGIFYVPRDPETLKVFLFSTKLNFFYYKICFELFYVRITRYFRFIKRKTLRFIYIFYFKILQLYAENVEFKFFLVQFDDWLWNYEITRLSIILNATQRFFVFNWEKKTHIVQDLKNIDFYR